MVVIPQPYSPKRQRLALGAFRLAPTLPNPAPPLLPQDLISVCNYLDSTNSGKPIKAAICIGYFAFLRASNLLSPSALLWMGPHTLSRADIVSSNQGLVVTLKSSKTILPGMIPTSLHLPEYLGPRSALQLPGMNMCKHPRQTTPHLLLYSLVEHPSPPHNL